MKSLQSNLPLQGGRARPALAEGRERVAVVVTELCARSGLSSDASPAIDSPKNTGRDAP